MLAGTHIVLSITELFNSEIVSACSFLIKKSEDITFLDDGLGHLLLAMSHLTLAITY